MANPFLTSGLFAGLFRDEAVAREFAGEAFVTRMLAFERAWTVALEDAGVASPDAARAALAAIDGFKPDFADLAATAERNGLPVPGLVDALRKALADDAAKAIHTGATSQDVIDTAMVMTCSDLCEMFCERLRAVLEAIDRLVAAFGGNTLMGRTRMQAALAVTVSHRLLAWRRPLARALDVAAQVRADLAVIQAAGPVGLRDKPDGFSEKIVEKLATELNLKSGDVWHSDRTRIVSFGHWLSLLSGHLGKLGLDVSLMAQQGIDEITIEGGGGSSAMPHKHNPVRAEALVTLARFVAGQQGILAQSLVHEQERSGTAWALEWMVLPSMAEATGAALGNAETLLGQVTHIGTPEN